MPKAVHLSTLVIPASNHPAFEPDGLVLEPGMALIVTDEQARQLVSYEGVTILPDEDAAVPFNGPETPLTNPSPSTSSGTPSRGRLAAQGAAPDPIRPETPAVAGSDAKE